jgi:hypothetical protein
MTRDRPRVRIAALATCALLLVLAPVAAGSARRVAHTAAARVPHGFVGMVLGTPLYPLSADSKIDLAPQLDSMVASGVESLRFVVNWSYAQPYASDRDVPVGQESDFIDVGGVPTRFDQIDQLVALAAQRRLKLLPDVLYAPGWDVAHHSGGTYGRPSSTRAYANFMSALVQRYGPRGSFWQTHSPKVPIRTWQIWNEPNITVFWPQQPFARSYVSLLAAAHAAIKRADPGARIVLAGMPNFSWKALGRIYAVRGARKLFDVVAVHPYTRQPSGVITILTKVRQVMNAAGDRRKPILADEISWPSSLGQTHHSEGFDFATTVAGQARNLTAMLPMLARDRAKLRLVGFDYYTWAGTDERGALAFDFAGLFHIHGDQLSAKPAFYAFRRAALALDGCREKGAVATVCLKRS